MIRTPGQKLLLIHTKQTFKPLLVKFFDPLVASIIYYQVNWIQSK